MINKESDFDSVLYNLMILFCENENSKLIPQTFKVNDKVRIISGESPIISKIEKIEFDKLNQNWKYYFRHEGCLSYVWECEIEKL